MIKYDPGNMGLLFVIQWKGSVFPKAMVWAIPNAIVAVLLHMYARQEQAGDDGGGGGLLDLTGVNLVWGGYTSVLGFLVVFRNNQAYTRFWEGATLINQVRGEWFNAVSTLFAFCNHTEEFHQRVDVFQHTLVRLASMLYCSALQQVCDLQDDTLEIIETQGMDQDSLTFMYDSNDRCEILLQWIQRLIVDSEESKAIKIAPPLLTRAFQELSRGIVNLNNARKIKDIPFPFPYAQMITVMMVVHWVATPLLASQVMQSTAAAAVVCFFVTFAFWCLIYIALEIDQPFGEDDNDLPLREMQRDFNQSLLRLMHPLAQKVPGYQAPTGRHLFKTSLSSSDNILLRASNSFEMVASSGSGADPIMSPGMTGLTSTKAGMRRSLNGWLPVFRSRQSEAGKKGTRRPSGGSDEASQLPYEPEPHVSPLPVSGGGASTVGVNRASITREGTDNIDKTSSTDPPPISPGSLSSRPRIVVEDHGDNAQFYVSQDAASQQSTSLRPEQDALRRSYQSSTSGGHQQESVRNSLQSNGHAGRQQAGLVPA